MARKVYNKLIRDKIPEIIKADRECEPKVSVLDEQNYQTELRKKLIEEAQEIIDAKTSEDVANELSDVLELVEAIASSNNLDQEEIFKLKEEKKIKRGGFEKKLFLEYVDEPENEKD